MQTVIADTDIVVERRVPLSSKDSLHATALQEGMRLRRGIKAAITAKGCFCPVCAFSYVSAHLILSSLFLLRMGEN
jgi:hypothetical protein